MNIDESQTNNADFTRLKQALQNEEEKLKLHNLFYFEMKHQMRT